MALKTIIVSGAIALLGAAPSLALTDLDEAAGRAAISEALSPWAGEASGPGAIIQVFHEGQPLLADMVGYADLEHQAPITQNTRFPVASVSKQFTAYAVVRLAQEGRLDLDAPVSAYIPQAQVYRDVTLRHLLAHTHRIRGAMSLVGASGLRPEDVVTNAHALDLILRQQAMNGPPGEVFSYNNSGFILLGEVVARVTGQSLADVCSELIFEPLGMTETVYADSLATVIPNRARSYVWTGEGYGRAPLNYALTGSTGLVTTGHNLALWTEHLDGLAQADPDFYATFHTLGVLNDGSRTTYAYGQERRVYRGLETWSHGGRDAGYRAFLLRAPSEDLSISVLSNAADFDIAKTTYAVLDALLSSRLDPEPSRASAPSAEQLEAYEGDYAIFPGLIFSLRVQNGTLAFAVLGEESFTPLRALSDHAFELNPDTGLAIVFDPEVEGPAQGFSYQLGLLGALPASRVELEPFDAATVDLQDFEGAFYSLELNTVYDLIVEQGRLLARHPASGTTVLSPYQVDTFNSANNYLQKLEFVRDETGEVTGLRLSGVLMVDVVFERVR